MYNFTGASLTDSLKSRLLMIGVTADNAAAAAVKVFNDAPSVDKSKVTNDTEAEAVILKYIATQNQGGGLDAFKQAASSDPILEQKGGKASKTSRPKATLDAMPDADKLKELVEVSGKITVSNVITQTPTLAERLQEENKEAMMTVKKQTGGNWAKWSAAVDALRGISENDPRNKDGLAQKAVQAFDELAKKNEDGVQVPANVNEKAKRSVKGYEVNTGSTELYWTAKPQYLAAKLMVTSAGIIPKNPASKTGITMTAKKYTAKDKTSRLGVKIWNRDSYLEQNKEGLMVGEKDGTTQKVMCKSAEVVEIPYLKGDKVLKYKARLSGIIELPKYKMSQKASAKFQADNIAEAIGTAAMVEPTSFDPSNLSAAQQSLAGLQDASLDLSVLTSLKSVYTVSSNAAATGDI